MGCLGSGGDCKVVARDGGRWSILRCDGGSRAAEGKRARRSQPPCPAAKKIESLQNLQNLFLQKSRLYIYGRV